MHVVSKENLPALRAAALILVVVVSACSHDTNSVPLVAAFDDDSALATVSAVWNATGEKRAFAGAARLREPEVRFQYRIDVRNRRGDKVFVRLNDFALADENGLELGKDQKRMECTLDAGGAEGLLSGETWIPERAAKRVRRFTIGRFAVPLDDRGRAQHREWLLQGRPDAAAEVDAEIARYAAAPPCSR